MLLLKLREEVRHFCVFAMSAMYANRLYRFLVCRLLLEG